MTDEFATMQPMGQGIEKAEWIGTGLFALTAGAALFDNTPVRAIAIATAVGLFVAGIVTFMWAYGVLAERSRTEALTLPGVFFLSKSVPKQKQRLFIGLEMVQLAVAFTTAGMRPFTSVAFGILAPMFGIGTMALYGAKLGNFPPRPVTDMSIRKNGRSNANAENSTPRERSTKRV